MIFYHLLRLQQLKLANEKLQVLASTDWLTTCLNRRAFTHLVTDRLGEAAHGAFLVIDADHFKVINDSLGHSLGDLLLQQVAGRLTSVLRAGDTVARLGGDEFALLLDGLESHEDAIRVAERVQVVERVRLDRPADPQLGVEGERLGVCLDSCHLYVSGCDVTDPDAVAAVLGGLLLLQIVNSVIADSSPTTFASGK